MTSQAAGCIPLYDVSMDHLCEGIPRTSVSWILPGVIYLVYIALLLPHVAQPRRADSLPTLPAPPPQMSVLRLKAVS